MNRPIENIDLLIRRVFAIGLFLFVLLIFKSTHSSVDESYNESGITEVAFENDNSAILVESFSFPAIDNLLASYELHSFNNNNNGIYKIICSNNKIKQLLLISNQRFLNIKPHLFIPYPHHVRTSLNGEDIPLIS